MLIAIQGENQEAGFYNFLCRFIFQAEIQDSIL